MFYQLSKNEEVTFIYNLQIDEDKDIIREIFELENILETFGCDFYILNEFNLISYKDKKGNERLEKLTKSNILEFLTKVQKGN